MEISNYLFEIDLRLMIWTIIFALWKYILWGVK